MGWLFIALVINGMIFSYKIGRLEKTVKMLSDENIKLFARVTFLVDIVDKIKKQQNPRQ